MIGYKMSHINYLPVSFTALAYGLWVSQAETSNNTM